MLPKQTPSLTQPAVTKLATTLKVVTTKNSVPGKRQYDLHPRLPLVVQ